MKMVLLLGIALSALCGCASSPVSIKDAIQVPADRVLAFQEPTQDKSASLSVIRDSAFQGGGCYYALWINQTLAARLDTSEVAKFFVEPGELLLRVGRDPQGNGLCALGQDQWVQRETLLKPGEQKTFRMTIGVNGELDIILSGIDQPKKLNSEVKYNAH